MKTLARILLGGMLGLSLLIPKFANAQEIINPFVQPNATTIYRGSGDVNSDGVVDVNDYSAMQNDSLTCIQADIDIDGIPSTKNDLEKLRQHVVEGKTRPSDWNKLQTKEQRLDLDRKTALVNKLGTQVPPLWINNRCVYLSLQEIINEAGYYGKPFPSDFDSTKNGQANLPIYLVSIFYPDNTPAHAITGKVIGDSLNGDPRIWDNWCFRDPQIPEKEVKIGDHNMRNIEGTKVRIEKITQFVLNGYASQDFIKFLIKDSAATCTFYDTGFVQLKREGTNSVKEIKYKEEIVKDFHLMQNYPNPFNLVTTIPYKIKKLSHVKLEVSNIPGQKLETLVDETQAPGSYEIKFDASKYASQMFLYQLRTGDFVETKRMVFVK